MEGNERTGVVRVRMEPELEARFGHLTWQERLEMARVLRAWARQLRVSGWAMRPAPPRGQRLRVLQVGVLAHN